MAGVERHFASTTCPYCSTPLDPLPKAKKACPTCGQPIYVRSGPDGYVYLLQTDDLPTMQAAWAEDLGARDDAALKMRLEEARVSLAKTLANCIAAGFNVEILTDNQSCAECRKLGGQTFDPRAAPRLPYERCRNEFCRCDYVPRPD